jgi:hypothetical protein
MLDINKLQKQKNTKKLIIKEKDYKGPYLESIYHVIQMVKN